MELKLKSLVASTFAPQVISPARFYFFETDPYLKLTSNYVAEDNLEL